MTRPLEGLWDRAGLTDAESGSLYRPLPTGTWDLPDEIELRDGNLKWTAYRWSEVTAGPALLPQFTNLHDADDKQILRFASHWGVLRLCAHNLPQCHPHNESVLPPPGQVTCAGR